MGKRLAIRGDKERGNEVIALLEMLGGDNSDTQCRGIEVDFYYYIDTYGRINYEDCFIEDEAEFFTLDEFYKKYPFKLNDKVIDTADGCPGVVSEMKWDEDVSDMKYFVVFGNGIDFGWYANDSIEFYKENENLEGTQSNQNIDKVVDIFRKEFCECCGSQRCSGQDDELVYCERFKNLMDNSGKPSVKNHKMGPKSKLPSKYYEVSLEETQPKRDIDKAEFMIKHMILPNKADDKLEYEIIDGYEFDKVENNKIILKPIRPKYPTTYEECWKVRFEVDGETTLEEFHNVSGYYSGPLGALQKLLCCRDAYWKIAGEEMGLGEPWKPDWSTSKPKYVLACTCNGTEKQWETTYCKTFAFPIAEIRDAFYENFKDLIEQCKELL